MDSDQWNRQEEGTEDICGAARVEFNPLLLLIAELVICEYAVEQHIGSFCAACTCTLGYHLACDSGECENCTCYEVCWLCSVCGQSRSIEKFKTGSKECNYCVNITPVRIKHPLRSVHATVLFQQTSGIEPRDRNKEARMVLRELTE